MKEMICPFCGFEMLVGESWTSNTIGFRYETQPSKNQDHTPALKSSSTVS